MKSLSIVFVGLLGITLAAAGTASATCDGVSRSEAGLCNAYCHAQDCPADSTHPSCDSLRNILERRSGLTDFPCDCNDLQLFDPAVGCVCDSGVASECAALGGTLDDDCNCEVPLCSLAAPTDSCQPGLCPPGQSCESTLDPTTGLELCGCAAPPACGPTAAGQCGGACPVGLTCTGIGIFPSPISSTASPPPTCGCTFGIPGPFPGPIPADFSGTITTDGAD